MNIDWIKSELQKSDILLNKTRTAKGPEFLPTRLIDVGGEEDLDAKLVNSTALARNGLDPTSYVTLSYCWVSDEDAKRQLKTLKNTLNSYDMSIPLDSVSPVVRDTVRVCRVLLVKYVWIDALCIIQDDKNDWDSESQTMGQIYHHAYFTLCPTASRTCHQSFLNLRDLGPKFPFSSRIKSGIKGNFRILRKSQ